MKRILILLLLVFPVALSSAQSDKRLRGIDKELESLLDDYKASGFAVAVVDNDNIIYSRGFGLRDRENNLPVTPNTLFAIGSCSKAFTSAILGQLQQETDLSLDDKPAKYINDFRFHNDEMNNQITIKDLMTHRTGLPRHDYSWYFFPTQDRDSLIRRVEFQEPAFGVREQWYYNNFMFLAQGVIAENITGKSWEQNIKDRFFQPLGMNRSNVDIEGLAADDDHAVGYETVNNQE
ncbi:MAG: serine hydrolase, partial [Cyclobacteriaceae bacterium]